MFYTGPKSTLSQLPLVVGPHSLEVLSLIFGSLLGDSHAEYRGRSTRISFKQSERHVEYLMWFHKFLADRGYCNPNPPQLKKLVGKKNKVYFYYRINSWSYASLNWIHYAFYNEGTKRVPLDIFLDLYLTPFALAVWIMDDGGATQGGLLLHTYSFPLEDVQRLVSFLHLKYQLRCHMRLTKSGPMIYIFKDSLPRLQSLVLHYILPSMRYKLLRG
uniref:Orf215 n=1 Tax=Hyaloraphidium curvatum TaxID=82268 RepID=Q950U4_HYACU|nr:orf215 [Hyaloraphidium curvatum]